MKIEQLKGKTICAWHNCNCENGKEYLQEEIFGKNVCPILFHTLYPYFLGFNYGAKYTYNKEGDCHVCCPAEKGIDLLVKKRKNILQFNNIEIPKDWRDIIYAEVIKINGKCDYNYNKTDIIFFPTFNKKAYVCPAGTNNIFPFIKVKQFDCINLNKLRCPDWEEKATVYYSLKTIN